MAIVRRDNGNSLKKRHLAGPKHGQFIEWSPFISTDRQDMLGKDVLTAQAHKIHIIQTVLPFLGAW